MEAVNQWKTYYTRRISHVSHKGRDTRSHFPGAEHSCRLTDTGYCHTPIRYTDSQPNCNKKKRCFLNSAAKNLTNTKGNKGTRRPNDAKVTFKVHISIRHRKVTLAGSYIKQKSYPLAHEQVYPPSWWSLQEPPLAHGAERQESDKHSVTSPASTASPKTSRFSPFT